MINRGRELGYMKYREVGVFLCIGMMVMAFPAAPAYPQTPSSEVKDRASWWIENMGVVTSSEDPLVTRAAEVFARVCAASDKSAKRMPRLITIKAKGKPWCLALKDGSIILTHGALTFCYKDVQLKDVQLKDVQYKDVQYKDVQLKNDKGDSRLAFLLGHELAHLANDDFWHQLFFSYINENMQDNEIKGQLKMQLEGTGDIRPDDPNFSQFVRTKELRADSYGIIYMTMAGYDPLSIVNDDGTNFFREWMAQLPDVQPSKDIYHPLPKIRAESVRTEMKAVADMLDYFAFGVRLYQLARYEDAILFLEAFNEHFPSREVFNNLALCHYGLAMQALCGCDSAFPVRFKLPTHIDPETLGKNVKTITARSSACCWQQETFKYHMSATIDLLREAISKDSRYLPGRINLSTALIMARKYSQAIGIADEALEIQPDNPEALNNKAVALYLFGAANSVDTADNALNILKRVADGHPLFSDALFNMARIQEERGRKAASQDTCRSFLKVEPTGIFARAVKENLNIPQDERTQRERTQKPHIQHLQPAPPKPPIELGPIKGRIKGGIKEKLEGMEHKRMVVGRFQSDIYKKNSTKIMAIDESIEVIEEPVKEERGIEGFKKTYGKPDRIIKGLTSETLLYDTYAVDVVKGMITRIIYFERQSMK